MLNEEDINNLQRLIDAAVNKPGHWHESRESQAFIVSVSEEEQRSRREKNMKLAPLEKLKLLFSDSELPGNIAQVNELEDARLAIAAVNALPELLALARDGLKSRAFQTSQGQ